MRLVQASNFNAPATGFTLKGMNFSSCDQVINSHLRHIPRTNPLLRIVKDVRTVIEKQGTIYIPKLESSSIENYGCGPSLNTKSYQL